MLLAWRVIADRTGTGSSPRGLPAQRDRYLRAPPRASAHCEGADLVEFESVEFELSSDQEALRDAAVDLLQRELPVERVRELAGVAEDARPRSDLDARLWQLMAEQGWLAIEQDEAAGGLGLGAVEAAVLCEEAARHLAPVPLAETILCLGALRGGAGSGMAGTWCGDVSERLALGRGAGCVCWTLSSQGIEVVPTGDGWELSGTGELVLWGPTADVMVVVATEGVYAVDLRRGGALIAQPAMDRTRSVGWAVMERARAIKIGGHDAATEVVDRAATLASAQLLGVAQRVLDMSVEHARERHQFGRAIGSFQAVKHRLADALVDVEAMRSSVYYAAWCLAAGDGNASLAASMAKAWCSEAAMRVVTSGLQVHGGIGFTWEHDLHLFVKRAQLDATVLGTATWHRERMAGFLHQRSGDPASLF